MKKSPLQIVGIQRPKNYKKVIDPNSGQGVKENILRAPKIKVKEPQVYNMTPNVSEEEAKKVRDKFDETYMKGRGKVSDSPLHGAYSEGKGMHGAVTGTDSEGNTIEFGNVDLGGTAEDESAWRDSTQNLFNSVMDAFDKTEVINGERKYRPNSGRSTQGAPCVGGKTRKWDPSIGTSGGWTCE